MDKTKQIAQSSQLNKQLGTLLSGFEKNKAWTDIGTWLFKVEQAMKENPSPFITEKLALAKRLAQCLNPVLPQAINLQSLKIYELIFENIKIASAGNVEEYKKMFCEDIGIYSVGLFPFFQNAHQKNKHYFLEIIRNYYIPVGRDLIPCLPGLVLSILPGLEEQSEILIKDVTKTLEGIMSTCGRRYFLGSVWMGIMRSQRGREHAIKFLMKLLPKIKSEEEDEEEEGGDDNSSNFSDDNFEEFDETKFQNEQFKKENSSKVAEQTPSKQQQQQQQQQQEQEQIENQVDDKDNFDEAQKQAQEQLIHFQNMIEGETTANVNNVVEQLEGVQNEIEKQLDEEEEQQVEELEGDQKQLSRQQIEEEIQKSITSPVKQDSTVASTIVQPPPPQVPAAPIKTQTEQKPPAKEQIEPTFISEQKKGGKSALELAFQHEVAPKVTKKQDFTNTFFIRDNLRYIEENINENDDNINFPNKSSLIINTILQCFDDEKPIVKRSILDLMQHHLRINHRILSRGDQLVLVEGVLYLLIKKDVSVTRRVNQWLFGKPDMDNKYTITKQREFVVDLLIDAFKRIFSVEPTDKVTAQQPLKIMQSFYMEHENLVDITLSKLAISFVKYVYTHSQNIQFSQEVLKSGMRFMENIAGQINSLIRSLSDEVVTLLSQNKDVECLEIINLIEFTYDNLLVSEEAFKPIYQRDCIKESLSRLFDSLSYLSEQNIREYQSLEPTLKVIYKLMIKLEKSEEKIKQAEKKDKKVYELDQGQREIAQYVDECAEKYFIFYGKLSNELENFKSNNVYKLASQSLVKLQKFLFDKKKMTQLPQWFKCISQSIKITNPNISLIAIESMIEIMISEKIDPIYEQLKILIIDEAKLKYSKKNELVAGNDYTKLTLEKLWSLLDFQHFYERIIDLIIYFSKYFPQYFKEVVVNSFQAVSITEKEAAIRRFAVFWRLTAHHKSKILLSELNKVGLFIMLDFLDHDNPLIRHASKNWLMESVPQFYRVIDPLFEVLLQANSSWYVTDSYQVFYTKIYETTRANETFRKLKSILIIASDVFLKYISSYELSPLLQDMKAHFTDKNQAILIRKLGATMSYFSTINPNSNTIDPMSMSQQSSQVSQSDKKVTDLKMSYLDLLIIICLRYIQGQALESLSLKFQVENAAVNASACEFLELLITHLEDQKLSLALCEYLMEPLLAILGHCITNRDYVMQVQLLNVFRIIFFHSAYIKNNIEEIRFKLVQVLQNKLFIPNILKGLMTSIPYVRSQFISFISACIPLLSTYLVSNQLTSIIKSIMFTYFSLIKFLATTPAQENDDSMVTISKTQIIKQPSLIKPNKTVILIQTQEVVKEDSNIYEIHTVLEGVRTILQFYLKIRTLEEIEKSKKEQEGGFANIMKSVLTLGMAGSSNDKDKDGKVIFEKHTETCKSLLYDIKQVVELFVNSWQTTPEFITEFTSYGIRPYEQKKYNAFNNILMDMIKNAENDKQRVKILIISIIKPLVYEFPNDMMNSFLLLWNRCCSTEPPTKHSDFSQNEFMKKMMEMITILNIPNELFLESFYQSFISEIIQNFYKQKNPKEKKNMLYLNYEIAQHETKLIYFLYIYLSYTYYDSAILKKENLLGFWNVILKILKVFQPSKNPNTVMWMLDLLYMLSEKYSPKEILSDSKFKKELHDLINEKLAFLSGWVSNVYTIKFNEPSAQTQQSLSNAVDQHMKDMIVQSLQQYKIISPFSPTAYEISLSFCSQVHILEHAPKNIANQMKDLYTTELDTFIFNQIDTAVDEAVIQDKFKMLILETLKALSLELLQNTYSPERQDRVVVRVKEFVDPLYAVIENKANSNAQLLESSSELICSLIEKAPTLLIKDFRKNILETFNKDNFFSCNKTTLRYWGKIIDWVITHDKSSDLFQEYLEKVGLSAGFFAREQTENKKKIKTFKRICFIIFSGSKDKYANRLRSLLDRIADVIKQADSTHSSLLILILFCIRILILRLSQNNLNDLFRQIWPILLTLLIQIYSKPLPGQPPRNPNLMLAGLKLIEILSIAQLDEFYLHQWMFIFDYFGLKLQSLSQSERENQMKLRGQMTEAQLRSNIKISPFYFQPFVSTCLNEQDLGVKYINEPIDETDTTQATTYQKKQRKIIMTQCKVDDESELKQQSLALCQYLISNNENRAEIDFNKIESLIEDDFINLDEHILKV